MERVRQPALGLTLAVASAFAFGIGGPFGKSLLEAGWSSSAIVLARCLGVFVLLTPLALVALRGRWAVLKRNAPVIAVYGAFAVVGAQLCFYTAIRYMPVGAALLIEYLAPVLLVGVAWVRTRRVPGGLVLVGCATAVGGLALVVDLGGARTEAIGPVLALAAAVGVAVYYVVSARVDPELPVVVLLAGAMLVASAVLLALAAVGLAPLEVAIGDVALLGSPAPWWVPLAIVVGVSTLAAYLLGVAGSARLGSRVASFVGLLEVLFAVLASWLLLADLPTAVQLVGGALILTGVVLVRAQPDRPGSRSAGPDLVTHRPLPLLSSRRRTAATRRSSRARP